MMEPSNTTASTRLTVGLLIYGAEDPTCRALWSGVDAVAREHDINLISFRTEPLHIPEGYLAQCNILYELVSAERLDGLVIWGGVLAHYVDHEEVLALLKTYAGIPKVNVSSQLPDMPNVLIDNYQGTYDGVTHLLEVHGCERLAFIRGPEGHVEAEARYRGYRHALRDHGLEINPDLVAPGDFARGTGLEAMRLLIEEREVSFDAVVTANDQLAMDVVEDLPRRGLRVPRDVAVVGFDNRPEAPFVTPPLTTIDQPWAEMGRRAAQLLLKKFEGDDSLPEIVKVSPRLVVRQSCGCEAHSVTAVSSPNLSKLSLSRAESEFEISYATARRVLAAIRDAAPDLTWQDENEWLVELLDAFMTDLNATSNDKFLVHLVEILRVSAEVDADLSRWQDVISVMRRELLGSFNTVQSLVRAEELWQRARIKIGEWTTRIQADRRFREARRQTLLGQIGQTLSTTLDVDELMGRIMEAMERLKISRCYLSLYENPSEPAAWARLLLAYAEGQQLISEKIRFPSQQLVPSDLLPSRRFSLHVEPLYFREHQLGFMTFDAQPQRGELYVVLQRDISRALYGSRLVEQAERRAARIQTTAEVAQAAGSLLNTETLIQRVVNVVREQFDLYYVGLFLVDDASEWAVLQAGTGEAGREMIAREHKLRVGGESMIGRCVVEKEAHIALDVGEEAVRFDNPWLPDTRSEMALPLISRGEVIGALTIQSAEPMAFGAMDVTTLQLMADQLGNAIANARLFEQAQREIAERREAEEALAYQEYLLTVLLENTQDHIFFKDRESRFIEVSQSVVDWFGAESREEIIGKTDFDFFSEEHARPAYEDEQKVIRTGEPILDKEEKEVRPDGRVNWVSTSKLPMRDRKGNVVGIFGVSRDITLLREAMNALERRGDQLQIAADVARTVTGILDVDTLLQRVVDLVRERFDLYYAGLFLIEERGAWSSRPGRWAVLRGGTGTAGQKMLDEGYEIVVDDTSLAGICILDGQPHVVADVSKSEKSLDNPLLPETCSEMALPLLSRGKPIGALTVHATDIAAFAEEDVTVFQTMAGQIATAIENARLLEQTRSALAEMETMQRRYIQRAWEEYLESEQRVSYMLGRSSEVVVDDDLQAAIQKAVSRQETVVLAQDGEHGEAREEILVIPALVRGQPIGAVALRSSGRGWTDDEMAMARLLTERMALTAENLRLFEESERAAAREHLLGELTGRVRERLDVETVLRTAADEIYRALDLEEVTVRLVDTDAISEES